MKKHTVSPCFKVISALLSVIILFYSIPATVWAFDDVSLASDTAIEEAEKADLSHSPYNGTIIEVKESRTLSDKTFRLSDGSFYERISEIRYRNGDSGNFTTRYRYTYDSSGNLYSIEDIANHEITVNDYDSSGILRSTLSYSSTDYYNRYGSHYYYDDESRCNEIHESFDYSVGAGHSDGGNCYLFDYTDEGTLDKLKIYDYNYSVESRPHYDNLGRVDTKTVTAGRSNSAHHFYNSLSFGYVSTEEYCTGRINQFRSTVKVSPESAAVSDTTYRYTYDQNGNITEIRTAGNVIEYKYCYDELGQLIREDNRPLGKTYKYTYDLNGNRKKKETYDFTLGTSGELRDRVDYTYGDPAWHDLLTKIGTSTIVQYDTIGNPVRIGDSTLTWEGRALRTRYDGQYQYLSYRYNSDGIRVFKEEYAEEPGYTVRHEYTVSGSRIIKETVYYDGSEIYTLVFSYDENGAPIGYRFRKPNYPESVYDYYYYDKNLQGDIIAVYGSHGDLLVSYIYDAWGKSFAEYSNESEGEYYNNSGEYFNPFRYRGYYYDEETGLYYLNSRYYDPEVGRFINADGQLNGGLLGNNLFAYCGNNPVNRIDPTGEAWWHWAIGAAVVAACAVATVITCGGFAAAATAVCLVANGVATAATASTIAAGAFIGSATVYGMAVLTAAATSDSVQEFYDQGNWGTVAATAWGGLTGGFDGYAMSKAQEVQCATDENTFLPDSFYEKHAPKQSTPNTSYTNYTYNNYTGEYEKSTAYYDCAGRQVIRIDWTNHGYSNHGNPHVHYTTYNSQYRDGFTVRWD